jgi:uncharacterized protein
MKHLLVARNLWFLFLASVLFIRTDCLAQDHKQVDALPLSFTNGGSVISGLFFKAETDKPAPTAILVQGFPGRDGDIKGIGSALRNAGVNALVFNYRGTWRSEGFFTVDNAINDVVRSVEFLKSPGIPAKYNIDTTKITLVGYSWGGGAVVLAAKSCPDVRKIVSIGTTDLNLISEMLESDSTYRRSNLEMLKKCVESKIVRGETTAEDSQRWMIAHRADLDLTRTVDALSGRQILFIGGWNDGQVLVEKHIIPLYRLFQKRNPSTVKLMLFDSDHSFNNVLPELHQAILNWMTR